MNNKVVEETVRLITENEILMEMANLIQKNTGLDVQIWADHDGKFRNKKDKKPRVKIGTNNYSVSVSIEREPQILAQTKNIKVNDMKKIKEAMKYVGRNYDLFLKHYNDENGEYSDYDLFVDLSKRGDFKL
jgi:hypothetical protein